MKAVFLCVALLLVALLSTADAAHIKARVSGVTPNHAGVSGGDIITIRGCGFQSYSSVVCSFDKRWASFSGTIVSDKEVQCESPVIPLEDLNSCVPHRAQLDLVFDGSESRLTVPVTPNFVIGPIIETLVPNIGFTQGGNILRIRGFHFDNLGSPNVTFDRRHVCENPSINDEGTEIQCVVPAGQFDHDAVIDVTFGRNSKCVAHSEHTYHYGPRFTSVFPPCTAVAGGTTVTLSGENLNDPFIQSTALPAANPRVELVFGNVRANATNVVFNGTAVVFRTASIPGVDTFTQKVRIDVFFKATAGKVTVGPPLHYGPIVYDVTSNGVGFANPVPATGHRGGGDRITLYGCGFSTFGKNQLSPVIQLNTQAELCFRSSGPGSVGDSLQIITNGNLAEDRLECVTNPFDCTPVTTTVGSGVNPLARNVQVVFRPGQRAPFRTSYSLPTTPLSYAPGPVVTSITPPNGVAAGGDLITIRGENFFSTRSAAGWSVQVNLAFSTLNSQAPPVNFTVGTNNLTAPGVLVSDEAILFRTPNNTEFGLRTSVSLRFFDSRTGREICPTIPRRNQPTFTYGPICTLINPTSGWLSGNREVTLTGNGFLQFTNTSQTDVRVCLKRLNNATQCTVFEPVSRAGNNFEVVSDNTIRFLTPTLRSGVPTPVGGNRLFGDVADIYVYFNGVNATNPRAYCGTYRFGPQVQRLTPDRGPMGPRAALSPGQLVTITGTEFDDPEYSSNIRVDIGTVSTNNAAVGGGQITANTIWGGVARSEQPVHVTFDTCNTTVSNLNVNWGPVITRVTGPDLLVPQSNTTGDLWGLFPHGGDIIVIQGDNFEEFLVNGRFEARCLFDGHPSTNTTLVPLPNGRFAIACTTPPRPPNTNASIAVEFGRMCGDAAQEIDWRNTVVATQRAHYRPRIDSFFPTFGLTSGSQTVTIFGEGFRDLYYCVFGHYTDGLAVQARIAAGVPLGTQVVCRTPPERGEFNTDVTVALQPVLFHNETGTLSPIVKADEKTIAPTRYHYGPVCTDIIPNAGVLAGGTTATLIGSGFQDCGFSNSFPFRNCTFVSIRVHFIDPITNQRVFTPGTANETAVNSITLQAPNTANSYVITTPQAPYCGFRPRVVIEYPFTVVMDPTRRFVECKNPNREFFYHYGPLVTGQTSQFQRNNISYGWEGTTVTLTGVNLDDPTAGSSRRCFFGTTRGDAPSSVTATSMVCTAPEQQLDRLVEITVDYNGGDQSCVAVDGGLFHYGPVMDVMTPTRTNVVTQPALTISGFAFGCCGITQVFCEFPNGQRVLATSTVNGTLGSSVTCLPPLNNLVDQQINYIGLTFVGAFGEHTVTVTESNQILSLYYGPLVTSITPSRISRLSGIGQSVTITGVGFTDPYFNGTFCDFLSATGGPDTTTTPTSVTDTQIICPIAHHAHRCQAIDNVRPRWSRNCGFFCSRRAELGTSYYKTNPRPAQPVDPTRGPFFADGGGFGDQTFPVSYGPSITSATTSVGAGPVFSPSLSLNSWSTGGLQIAVNFDDLGDWVSGAVTNDFGTEQAWCVFGDRVSATSTPIRIVGTQHFVNCTVPPGAVGLTGQLKVVLDPHRDQFTSFPVTTTGTDFWHWVPHAETLSRRWGFATGHENIVVSGGGFCQYRSVVCTFTDSLFGGIQGVQGEIINDHSVLCVTPPTAPSALQVRLDFCSLQDTCDCLHRGAVDTAPVGLSFLNTNKKRAVERISDGQFTFVGVSSIEPTEGPSCGGTDVTVRGVGFNFFEQPHCIIGGNSVPAIPNGDNALVCVTPDVHRDSDARLLPTQRVTCNNFVVSGVFGAGSGIHHMVAPSKFEFGAPEVFTVRPRSADITQQTTVYIGGKYFNGNFIGEYLCKFGDLTPVRGQLTVGDPDPTDDDDTLQEIIACPTPSLATFPRLTIGTVDLEVRFDCEQASFTSDRIPFTFTKRSPSIRGIFPDHGFEIGGTVVTVFGSRFEGGTRYFCAFGDVDDDDDENHQLASAELDFTSLEEPTLRCLVPANIVPFSTRVDVSISVDGGETFIKSPRGFLYDDVPTDCISAGVTLFSATSTVLVSLVAVLLAVIVM